MCMFSAVVTSVSTTKIFARTSSSGEGSSERQYLVYAMDYEAQADLAMILPLPTPPDSPEDSVRFIDLSDYEDFFYDLYRPYITRSYSGRETLNVVDVGSFQASFVPTQEDFQRLDPRFRLPEDVWSQLPQYSDYGFAVFKLKSGAKKVHPMAFEFPRRAGVGLFFPTVHVHDGEVESEAEFGHTLYCQSATSFKESGLGDHLFAKKASEHVDIQRAQGIVDAELPIQMQMMFGRYPNEDVILDELMTG